MFLSKTGCEDKDIAMGDFGMGFRSCRREGGYGYMVFSYLEKFQDEEEGRLVQCESNQELFAVGGLRTEVT